MINRKIVVRTKYQLSKNNPDGKYKKNKIENIDKYTDKMLDYYSNIDKKALSLVDYYTGKINKHEDINLILENGKYADKNELERRKKYIAKQVNNSNLWQMIISFNNDYIDSHISLNDLEQIISKDIIPQFLKHMGFNDIKNMQYQLSLHSNTDNYHFHIAFMEKKPNTLNSNNKLCYRRKGKIPIKSINFLKKQINLAIEREFEFKPKAIEINKTIDNIKDYFKTDSYNNILKDKNNILLEEKILSLGKLISEKINSENKSIKFNSIYDEEIKELTKEIKKYLFDTKDELIISKKQFSEKINSMNDYFKSIVKINNISMKEIDLSYTNNKEKYLDNYILNAIVNYARYNYKKSIDKIKITGDDIIHSIILSNYHKNKNVTKKNILENYYHKGNNKYIMKSNIRNSIKRINDELEEAANEFHKLFINENDKVL